MLVTEGYTERHDFSVVADTLLTHSGDGVQKDCGGVVWMSSESTSWTGSGNNRRCVA